jgi:hypothetical protein
MEIRAADASDRDVSRITPITSAPPRLASLDEDAGTKLVGVPVWAPN